MKIILLMANVLIWSILAQQFFPWWIIGVVCFVTAYILKPNKFIGFSASLLAVFILWTIKVWHADSHFDVPMSGLLGGLFGNVSGSAIYFLTGLIGGLFAGLSGLLGTWTRQLSAPPSKVTTLHRQKK